ncbi:ACT domain-containing protein [Altererythrobacter arenosus]|uniref:ACT domain-containing protein n=1 Tax=Altererythrobacter arenosus TaxID=3032592 RepID=A0ABY8FT61_9SPHN|nr:ACT domain-containing protein [Altererythrobacter sp. CAU 1644]WFL78194.1 ACT domain-containing protein [Altererythrobacter sp. CAU 1644]
MSGAISDRSEMLTQMAPRLDPVRYCFMVITPDTAPQALGAAIGTFREDEGVTAIVPEPVARELGEEGPAFARITLMVHSSLEGVGLTAAVASALAEAGIACNMVAAFHHDHAFVPAARGEEALSLLADLARSAA